MGVIVRTPGVRPRQPGSRRRGWRNFRGRRRGFGDQCYLWHPQARRAGRARAVQPRLTLAVAQGLGRQPRLRQQHQESGWPRLVRRPVESNLNYRRGSGDSAIPADLRYQVSGSAFVRRRGCGLDLPGGTRRRSARTFRANLFSVCLTSLLPGKPATWHDPPAL